MTATAHNLAELNRGRSCQLRIEARTLTGPALRSTTRDAVWHRDEARRLDVASPRNRGNHRD